MSNPLPAVGLAGPPALSSDWLRAAIGQLVAYPVNRIEDDSHLRDELGLDSSDLMFLQLQIEAETGGPLHRDDALEIFTFGDLRRAIALAIATPV